MRRMICFLLLMASAQAAPKKQAPQPYGWLDASHCSPFYGWAMDRAQPGMVKVNLYVDGKYSKSAPANLPRPDVETAGFGKNRGFEIILPQKYYDGKPHTFEVLVTGSEWRLVNSPVVLTCSNMDPAPSATPGPTATPFPTPSASPTPPPVPTPTPSPITLTASWTDTITTNFTGYRVLYGKAPRQYSEVKDVGKVTSTDLTVSLGEPWYFTLVAYNAAGEESQFSNAATYP